MNQATQVSPYRPLWAVVGFLSLTLTMYVSGPLPWPPINRSFTVILLLTTWTALTIGFSVAVQRSISQPAQARTFDVQKLGAIALVSNFVTLPIAIYGYTGTWVGDLTFDLGSQGDVYVDRYQFLLSGGGGRIRLLAASSRAIVAPAIYGALILGMRQFTTMTARGRLYVLGNVAAQVMFSFSRGTDKEIVDLAIFAAAAVLGNNRRSIRTHIRSLALGAGLVLIVLVIFSGRREARYSGEISLCNIQANVCADSDQSTFSGALGPTAYGSFVSLDNYLTQGYHGLALAQQLDHQWTFGLGSLPVVQRVFVTITGAESLTSRNYHDRLTEHGWDKRYGWSTLYTYIANDTTFLLVPFAVSIIGFYFGSMWKRGLAGQAAPYVISVFLLQLLVYSPANNQIAISMENFAAFIVWLIMAKTERRTRMLNFDPHIDDQPQDPRTGDREVMI